MSHRHLNGLLLPNKVSGRYSGTLGCPATSLTLLPGAKLAVAVAVAVAAAAAMSAVAAVVTGSASRALVKAGCMQVEQGRQLCLLPYRADANPYFAHCKVWAAPRAVETIGTALRFGN